MSESDDADKNAFLGPPPAPLNFLPANVPDPISERPPPRRRIRVVPLLLGVVAWGVIVGSVVVSFILRHVAEESPRELAVKDSLNLYLLQAQARYLLGAREFTAGTASANSYQLYLQAQAMNTGPVDQRLRFIVLAGELEGPREALDQMMQLEKRLKDKNVSLTADQQGQLRTLHKLYADYARLRYDAPSVTASEREQLRQQLGWFGDLALAPAGQPGMREGIAAVTGLPAVAWLRDACPDPEARRLVLLPARRTVLVAWLVVALVLGLGFLGLVLLAGLVFLLALGKVRGGLDCGNSPAGIYVETFALWLIYLVGMSAGLSKLRLGDWQLMSSGLGMLLSLVVLLWPRLRGIPFRQLREDIGWTWGRQPRLEPAAGGAAYVMAVPLLLVGVVVVMLLTLLQNLLQGGGPGPDDFALPGNPAHPIVIELARGNWGLRLQVFFLASIVAPMVEETMFRGVFYRHLRELTCGLDTVASVLFSTLLCSFVFAIMHPQGVLAVPALMALACGFALAREWRGTLVPAMVAHGLNNTAVLLVAIAILGD